MLKKLALLMLLFSNLVVAQNTTNLDPTQVYNTGNIVNWGPPTSNGGGVSPWINGVYQQNLTCWAWGDPGNCGPSPTVRANYGSINFSFGMTDIHQIANIASVLPNSGTGLNVNGYTFSFLAKNGNGWDNGQQDYLTAYVKLYDTKGSTVVDNQYNLNYQFNWTYFNFNKTFDTPYASKDLSTVQYGFVGMDSNFWAGTYGPEISSISFNLKYSVDPCATNPLFSPTCPGYMDALNKLLPPSTTTATVDPVTTTSISPTSTTTIVTDPITPSVSVSSTTSIGQPSIVSPVVSAPTATTATTTATTNSTSSNQVAKETSSGGNTNLAMSIISKNQERDAAGSAVAQSAVAQAQQAANQAQQEAANIASNAASNSTTMNAASTSGQASSGNGIRMNLNANTTNFTLQSGIASIGNVASGPQTSNNIFVQQQTSVAGLTTMNNQSTSVSSVGSQQVASVSSFVLPLLQPQQPIFNSPSVFTQTEQQIQSQTILQNNIATTQFNETYTVMPPNFITDKTNPLTDIIEGKQNVPQAATMAMVGPSVNKNAGDNEIAGGVDINRMALMPIGYGDYLNLAMRDASFYAPKEVYKNQRNVDNVRALRQLSSDSRHKEMMEMQYAK